MASQYERELRSVLAGVPKGVEAVTRSCDAIAKASAMKVIDRPFLVVRAAGSGMEGSGTGTEAGSGAEAGSLPCLHYILYYGLNFGPNYAIHNHACTTRE